MTYQLRPVYAAETSLHDMLQILFIGQVSRLKLADIEPVADEVSVEIARSGESVNDCDVDVGVSAFCGRPTLQELSRWLDQD